MSSVWITIKKELRTLVRDKKTFLILLAMPVISSLCVLFYGFIMDYEVKEYDEVHEIGIDFDINMIEEVYLSEYGLSPNIYDNKEALENAFNDKKIEGYIDYNNEENKYYIYTDSSNDGVAVSTLITSYFASLNSQKMVEYLISEDIDYEKINNTYEYESVTLEGTNYLLNMIYGVVFSMIIMDIVCTASNMATSATATEKENGTLETLISFPITKKELILGKYLAILIACAVTSLLEFALTILVLYISTFLFTSFASLNITFGGLNFVLGVIICIIASLFISSLSLFLTSNSKSYKEAQSSVSLLTFVSMVPMFVDMFISNMNTLYYIIPVVNVSQILIDLYSSGFNILNYILTVLSTLIYGVIVYIIVVRVYKGERVLFDK